MSVPSKLYIHLTISHFHISTHPCTFKFSYNNIILYIIIIIHISQPTQMCGNVDLWIYLHIVHFALMFERRICWRIVFGVRIVPFALIFKRRICHAVYSSMLSHRALLCILHWSLHAALAFHAHSFCNKKRRMSQPDLRLSSDMHSFYWKSSGSYSITIPSFFLS